MENQPSVKNDLATVVLVVNESAIDDPHAILYAVELLYSLRALADNRVPSSFMLVSYEMTLDCAMKVHKEVSLGKLGNYVVTVVTPKEASNVGCGLSETGGGAFDCPLACHSC
jgi:hypothetical protein